MTQTPNPPDSQPSPEIWMQLRQLLRHTITPRPTPVEARISVAGDALTLRFASPALQHRIFPALAHRPAHTHPSPGLTILVHDYASAPEIPALLSNIRIASSGEEYWVFHQGGLVVNLQHQGRVLSAIDLESRTAWWIGPSPDAVEYTERAHPLRLILTQWQQSRGRNLVHAAAVGIPSGCALIIGQGGAGKSTTAMACATGGLLYLSDDICLVQDSPSPAVHSLYSSAKLAVQGLTRFPTLAPAADPHGRPDSEKLVLFFHQLAAVTTLPTLPLRALLLPTITATAQTTIRPSTSGQAFLQLTPSCIWHLPHLRPQLLASFAALARRVPVYTLALGSDFASTPVAIRTLLLHLEQHPSESA